MFYIRTTEVKNGARNDDRTVEVSHHNKRNTSKRLISACVETQVVIKSAEKVAADHADFFDDQTAKRA